MAVICPTVTASDAHEYRAQIERVSVFAKRIHIDLMDGELAPSRSINPVQVYWPPDVTTDIHLMYKRPLEHIETLVSLHPHMVIIHAEAEGDLGGMVEHLHKFGIKVGLALLPDTSVESVGQLLTMVDHVLVFDGHLGYQGGTADLSQLHKVAEIRAINPSVEISVDGGVSVENAKQIVEAGVDVLDVGGAIQHAEDPIVAYNDLVKAVA